MGEGPEQRSARELWHDYCFLTGEMARFLLKKDMELFFELMRQREQVQAAIANCEADDFAATAEGRGLFESIQRENTVIKQGLQFTINNGKQGQTIAKAYDRYGAQIAAGRRLDTKR